MFNCESNTLLRRPVSVHQVDKDRLALLFSVVGKGTEWLSKRSIGDKIDILGPLGNGFSINSGTKRLLLVAGGIGIAPIVFLAKEAIRRELSVTLLLGAQTKDCLYPQDLLSDDIELVIATDDGTSGRKGMVSELLPKFSNRCDQVFACGPSAMYRHIHNNNENFLKGNPAQISLEMRMGCGFGVCYGCTIKTKNGLNQVCQDGPVFDLDDILWDELDNWL